MTAPQIDLQNYPAYRAKMLEVIQELSVALNALPHTRFYMTGGAAAEFLLANTQPIYDIDCVCVINPALSEAEHKAARERAIATAAGILKHHLEGPMSPELMAETATMSGVEIAGQGFSNYTGTGIYNPFTSGVNHIMIPPGSPFTGIYYYDRSRKIYVLSIRHRTSFEYTQMQSLMDISFPARDYERYAEKWRESGFLRDLTKNGKAFKSLTPIWLAANQQYAANHTNNAEKKTRRLNRVRRLSARFPAPRVPTNRPLPVVHATIAYRGPPVRGTTVGAAPQMRQTPPADLSVNVSMRDGRVYLNDHMARHSWPARELYDPYMPDKEYTFDSGFRGKLGNYWLHAGGQYYPLPTNKK